MVSVSRVENDTKFSYIHMVYQFHLSETSRPVVIIAYTFTEKVHVYGNGSIRFDNCRFCDGIIIDGDVDVLLGKECILDGGQPETCPSTSACPSSSCCSKKRRKPNYNDGNLSKRLRR